MSKTPCAFKNPKSHKLTNLVPYEAAERVGDDGDDEGQGGPQPVLRDGHAHDVTEVARQRDGHGVVVPADAERGGGQRPHGGGPQRRRPVELVVTFLLILRRYLL